MEEKFVADEIFYLESNKDKSSVILMLHGLAGSGDVWFWNYPHLMDHHCIIPDLPGNGRSANSDKPYTIREYCFSMIRLLDHLQLEKVHWCGHSMGGQIALYAALHFPERVNKLILSSPAGFEFFTPLEVQLLKHGIRMNPFIQLDNGFMKDMYLSAFSSTHESSKTLYRKIKEMTHGRDHISYVHMLKESMIAMLEEQLFHQLPLIKKETVIFFGEMDPMIPNPIMHASQSTRNIARKGHDQLAGSQLILFPDAGHFPHIEKYAEFNTFLTEWLRIP